MIIRLWSLTLLATQLALGIDHSIDYTRCASGETTCLVRESCIKDKTNENALVEFKTETLKDEFKDGCDAVIQVKAFNKLKIHVMMQLNVTDGKLNKDEGLKLDQGGIVFHCKPGPVPVGMQGITLASLGSPYYHENRIFCSFTADFSPLSPPIQKIGVFNLAKDNIFPTLLYMNDGIKKEIKYPIAENSMWHAFGDKKKCDHDKVRSSRKDGGEGILMTEVDTTLNELVCPVPFSVEKPDEIKPKRVFCDTSDNKWKAEKGDGSKIELDTDFQVFCPDFLCRKCDTPPIPLQCGSDCKDLNFSFDVAAKDKCPVLSCPNSKWTVDGITIITGDAKCGPISGSDPEKYSWFLGTKELTTAACLEKINCGARFNETKRYPEVDASCPGGADCKIKGLRTPTISCEDGYEMKLNGEKILTDVTCDEKTGYYKASDNTKVDGKITCTQQDTTSKGTASQAGGDHLLGAAVAGTILVVGIIIVGIVLFCLRKRKQKAEAANKGASKEQQTTSAKKSIKTNTKSTVSSINGEVADGSDGKKKSTSRKSKKEEKEKKFKLEDYETWTHEQFQKLIMPNFKTCEPESKRKWVRNYMGRFYAYSNTKKTPESGTSKQFWLLVKQCMDDKCEDGPVWRELFRIAFTMQFSIKEKTNATDEFRLLVIKPFEAYMIEYLKKCDFYMRAGEPRHLTEMRVICLEILLHTRHPDVTEVLRTLTFNEKLEVPLRMLTAACYTRERDEKPSTVHLQYLRVHGGSVLDPHIAEGWGTYVQHVIFGLAGYLITVKDVYQYLFFDALYQNDIAKDPTKDRKFSPSDWLFAYKGALLHENSSTIAMEMFKKYNEGSLLHIEALLKQKHKEEDQEEREKTREQYQKDMKEYTLMLADLLVGEEEFNEFKSNLRFVILFIGEQATKGDVLSEERVRERAINMGNMVRDRDFAKQNNEALKAIGAKTTA